MSGNYLCLLATERPRSGSSSSWRVCIDECEEKDGLLTAEGFRNIAAHEDRVRLLRNTTGMFVPYYLAKAIYTTGG